MLRKAVLKAARSDAVRGAATSTHVLRGAYRKLVAGEDVSDAIAVANELSEQGLYSSIAYWAMPPEDMDQARSIAGGYQAALKALADAGLADRSDVSISLGSLGANLDDSGGRKLALDLADGICSHADKIGSTVTIEMGQPNTTGSTVDALLTLRRNHPTAGLVLQADLRRTEADCVSLSEAGSRIRLVKGAYGGPSDIAFSSRHDVDLSFVRCARALMEGQGTPMFATHDSRLIEITGALATLTDRSRRSYEYNLAYGVRPEEQRRLASAGERVRVYVPFGPAWYEYVVRSMSRGMRS